MCCLKWNCDVPRTGKGRNWEINKFVFTYVLVTCDMAALVIVVMSMFEH